MQGDVLTVLARLPSDHFHAVVTSPPYWGLRDYGVEGQIGLEPTPELFIAKMVSVFAAVRRVLRPDGTLWLNLGDSYVANRGNTEANPGYDNKAAHGGANLAIKQFTMPGKPKDLIGIPWRVALALQADGWWLRSDIIWHKPNPMPESVTDRPTKAHEYVFLLTKAARYYYDAEAVKETTEFSNTHSRGTKLSPPKEAAGVAAGNGHKGWTQSTLDPVSSRNLRDVWTIPSQPYTEAHFATFPEALVEKPILAGTSEKGCCAECGAPWERQVETSQEILSATGGPGGSGHDHEGMARHTSGPRTRRIDKTTGWCASCTHDAAVVPCTVLDPFAGSGTTLAVARRLGRNAVGIELNPAYVKLAEKRLEAVPLAFGAV